MEDPIGEKHGIISGMKKWPRFLCTLIIYAFLVSACGNISEKDNPGLDPATQPAPDPTPTPTAASEPPISIEQLTLQHSMGRATVLGLATNQSSLTLSDIRIRIDITDQSNRTSSTVTSLLMEHLGPGENSPFAAIVENMELPSHASAAVFDYQSTDFKRVLLEFEEPELRHSADGTWLTLKVANPSAAPVCLHSLRVAGFTSTGELQSISETAIGLHAAVPGAELDYFVPFEKVEPDAKFEIYADSQHCEVDLQAPNVEVQAEIRYDSQDNPFILGTLTSGLDSPIQTAALITLRSENRVLSMVEVRPPIPLPGNEPIPFTITSFPTLAHEELRELHRADSLTVSILLDPIRTHQAQQLPVMLAAGLTALETTGSRLVINGEIINNQDYPVTQPSILVQITTTEGELITAGWEITADKAEPDESMPFHLILPIPDGFDLRLSEHDVRAFGIMVSDGQ